MAKDPDLNRFVAIAVSSGSAGHRAWVKDGVVRAYLRWTRRYIESSTGHMSQHQTFEIANAEVEEEYRRKGYFKAFLAQVEHYAQQQLRTVYIENVLDAELAKYLSTRYGYKLVRGNNTLPCYYKAADCSFTTEEADENFAGPLGDEE